MSTVVDHCGRTFDSIDKMKISQSARRALAGLRPWCIHWEARVSVRLSSAPPLLARVVTLMALPQCGLPPELIRRLPIDAINLNVGNRHRPSVTRQGSDEEDPRMVCALRDWSSVPAYDRDHHRNSGERRGGDSARRLDSRPARCAGERTCHRNRNRPSSRGRCAYPRIVPRGADRPECCKRSRNVRWESPGRDPGCLATTARRSKR